jgi:hypothetical protein
MGRQSNKVQKRQRKERYLKRKKETAKAGVKKTAKAETA